MPQVGVPNNPGGANGWDGFGTEEPYGQATHDAALQGGAPLAGGPIAAGPIAAPRRASRQAQRGTPAPAQPQTAPAAMPAAAAQQISPEAKVAQYWQAIAAIPGASELVKLYAGQHAAA